MKNLFLISVFSFFAVMSSVAQTNVSFVKASSLKDKEGRVFNTWTGAIDYLIDGARDTLVGSIWSYRFTMSLRNNEKTYDGRDTITREEIINLLGWLKFHPEDTSLYNLRVHRLASGNYVLETLTWNGEYWVPGKDIERPSHAGEWVMEFLFEKIVSTYCLNGFPTVGKIVKPGAVSQTSCAKPPVPRGPELPPAIDAGRSCQKKAPVFGEVYILTTEIAAFRTDGCCYTYPVGTTYSEGQLVFITPAQLPDYPRTIRRYVNAYGESCVMSLILQNLQAGDSREYEAEQLKRYYTGG